MTILRVVKLVLRFINNLLFKVFDFFSGHYVLEHEDFASMIVVEFKLIFDFDTANTWASVVL